MARTAVIAGTATAASNRVSRRQAERWSQQEAQNQPQQAAPAPQQSAGSDDAMAQLQKLGELHSQGILTDEEFATKKQDILSRM
jgi:hypothetical protein